MIILIYSEDSSTPEDKLLKRCFRQGITIYEINMTFNKKLKKLKLGKLSDTLRTKIQLTIREKCAINKYLLFSNILQFCYHYI